MRKLRFISFVLAALWLTVTILNCGCARFIPDRPVKAAEQTTRIHDRAGKRFSRAILLKPERISGDVSDELAPLFIVEQPTNACSIPSKQSRRGRRLTPARVPVCPRVIQFIRTIEINARPHLQITYIWSGLAPGSSSKASPQCIRMTLNSAGFPVLWEVLSESVRQKIVYVAESLEQGAEREYGAPFFGRQFSIERSMRDYPDVIVAKVLADGPIPMGPFVYLEGQSRLVTTILCRCMPAQVDEISETQTYHLQNLSAQTPGDVVTALAAMGCDEHWGEITERLARSDSISDSLRLPHEF